MRQEAAMATDRDLRVVVMAQERKQGLAVTAAEGH